MAARAISSGTISFGLVSIPVKLFTATSAQQAHFNMLHAGTKGRVKQQYVLPGNGEVVDRKQLVKGYEYARGQFVIFSDEELKALESKRTSTFDIVEFVPLDTVDLIQVEKTYYMGPDKGGDKAYKLLAESMQATGKVAVGRWGARGKDQLVIIRPYKQGLLLHQMFYANEVRAFDEVDTGAVMEFSELERELARKLINELTVSKFAPEKYKDDFEQRLAAAVETKVRGQEIVAAPEVPRAQIFDLFDALKQSLQQVQSRPAEGGDELKPRPVEKARPRDADELEKKTGS
ncbi:MAG TPA: Ku protein [Polyangiaceae bacterium]|jgi:DNA end-binding protein Ku|nr:Ku protein [Polyangiaceae bacterium]